MHTLHSQDDELWHRADTDRHENEGEGELFEFGQECLDRLSLSLAGNAVVPLASGLLPQLLSSQDWKQRHAALICLAQIAEGCAKVMHKNMTGLVDMCLRVRPHSGLLSFLSLRMNAARPLMDERELNIEPN